MTVAVGVLCEQGIVIGADREVTYDAIKTSERKVHLLGHGSCRVALAGSGTHKLITYTAQTLRTRLQERGVWSCDEVRAEVVRIYGEVKRSHIDPSPQLYSLDLLVGIKIGEPQASREMRLLAIEHGGIATWVEDDVKYAAVGYGHTIARYLLKRLYGVRGRPSVARGVSMVAHVIKETKDNVADVGKESDIIFMRWGYQSAEIPEADILEHERVTERFMQAVQPVMMALADINIGNDRLNDIIGNLSAELHAMRSNGFLQRQAEKFVAGSVPRVMIHSNECSSAFVSHGFLDRIGSPDDE
jgi:20S proteasome alpha/beta subunit